MVARRLPRTASRSEVGRRPQDDGKGESLREFRPDRHLVVQRVPVLEVDHRRQEVDEPGRGCLSRLLDLFGSHPRRHRRRLAPGNAVQHTCHGDDRPREDADPPQHPFVVPRQGEQPEPHPRRHQRARQAVLAHDSEPDRERQGRADPGPGSIHVGHTVTCSQSDKFVPALPADRRPEGLTPARSNDRT